MKPLFEEKQRYTQWWLWLIIVSGAAIGIGIFVYGMFVQLVMKTPWGNDPMSNDTLITVSFITITALCVMLMIFFSAVLEIVVDRSGVSYRYFPLIRSWRRIERESIQSYQQRKYFPTGYGIQRDLTGDKIINVKGNVGVEFVTFDGVRLTLGTQKPNEFVSALNQMKSGRAD